MSFAAASLTKIIEPAVELLGYEFVACEVIPQGQRTLLRIYIDSKDGITIRDCEIVSRQIGSVLDVEDPIRGKYNLEVSSPGDDRILVKEEHYQKFQGRHIKVKLRQARNGRSNYSGLLQAVAEGKITIIVDGDTYVLAISDIEKAKLVPES